MVNGKKEQRPVAVEVQVDSGATFLTNSSSNFLTHKLFRVGAGRLELRPTPAAFIANLIFVLLGVILCIASVFADLGATGKFLLMAAGLAAIAVTGYLAFPSLTPKTFDRETGLFSKASRRFRLDDIAALQLLAGQSRSSHFYSYELNLVFVDGTRFNVIETGGSHRVVREYAGTLAAFLEKPLVQG